MRKISRNLHLKKNKKFVFKQICRGKTTKFVESKSHFVWVCLLLTKQKEDCALKTVSQKFKIRTLVFSLGGAVQTTTFNAVPGSVLGLRNSAEIGQFLF